MNPSIEITKSLAALDGNRDFGVVLQWLREDLGAQINELLLSTNPILVHQKQGYALCLTDIIQSATTATKALSRLRDG